MATMSKLQWSRLFNWLPVPVLYSRRLVGQGFAGRSFGVAIAIHPDYRDDTGLLAHELEHCRQFYRSLGVSAVLYALSKRQRYRQELACYRIQLAHQPRLQRRYYAGLYAQFIVDKYRLRVDYDTVLTDLLAQSGEIYV